MSGHVAWIPRTGFGRVVSSLVTTRRPDFPAHRLEHYANITTIRHPSATCTGGFTAEPAASTHQLFAAFVDPQFEGSQFSVSDPGGDLVENVREDLAKVAGAAVVRGVDSPGQRSQKPPLIDEINT